MQGAERGRILITMMELDDGGNIVFGKEMKTEELSVLPPGCVTIIQDGSQIN
jgi:hypothetical protein